MSTNWLKKVCGVLTAFATTAATAALGIGFSAPAYAEDNAATSITINAPSKVDGNSLYAPTLKNCQFTAYKLANYANVKTAGNPAQITSIDYKNATGITDAMLDSWIISALQAYPSELTDVAQVNNGDLTFLGDAAAMTPMQFVASYFYGNGGDEYGNKTVNSETMRVFAQAAEKSLKGTTSGVETAPVTVADDGNSATVDAAASGQGVYLIIDTTTGLNTQIPARAMVAGTPCTVNNVAYTEFHGGQAVYKLGQINLKAEQVVNSIDIASSDANKGALATVGSRRTFQATSNIPNYAEYQYWENPKYSMTLTPTSNIALDANSITVEVQELGKSKYTALANGTDYSVVLPQSGASDNALTISFANPNSAKMSGATVRVTINGTVQNLQTDASYVTVQTKFSNNANDSESVSNGAVASTMPLYDARTPLKKIPFDGTTSTAALTGAQFSVTPQGGAALKFTKTTLSNGQTLYQVDPNGSESTVTIGEATLAGLAADSKTPVTYTFLETEAPEGYILDSRHAVKFTVTVTPNITNNALVSVNFHRIHGNYANFLNVGDQAMAGDSGQTVAVPAKAQNGTFASTHVQSSEIYIKNTKNPADFAQTGGHILAVLIAVIVLAVLGGALLIVARIRRRA